MGNNIYRVISYNAKLLWENINLGTIYVKIEQTVNLYLHTKLFVDLKQSTLPTQKSWRCKVCQSLTKNLICTYLESKWQKII